MKLPRRVLTISLMTLLLATGMQVAHADDYTHHGERPCTGWRFDVTNPATRPTRGPRLVACVFTQLGLVSQIGTAQAVANRESHYGPLAYNPSGCGGIYQHMLKYWPGRRVAYLPRWLFPRRYLVSWTNALANVWVTARMVKSNGWGPWS